MTDVILILRKLPAGLDALEELAHRIASWLPAEPEG
jgi:hypothetical protein